MLVPYIQLFQALERVGTAFDEGIQHCLRGFNSAYLISPIQVPQPALTNKSHFAPQTPQPLRLKLWVPKDHFGFSAWETRHFIHVS